MKLTCFLVLIIAAIFTINPRLQAQSINSENLKQVKVDDLSDAEIKAYYQKAVSSGLSEEQLLTIATQRGMPAGEISKLRLRLAGLNSKSASIADTSKNAESTSAGRLINEDAMNVPMQKLQRDSNVFGSELFTSSSMVFEPNLRIPTPSNYILGPDDQLIVNVYGYSEQSYSLTVNAEGNIYIPNVGPIKVSGFSIEEAGDRIRNKLAATIYRAISSGQTKVEVSLGKIRSIRVTVIGQASKPGTYTVSSLTTLFNMLYLCGGPNEMGSFRNIELIRGNKPVRFIDLYNFLLLGERKDNVLLQEQDVIRIPYYSIRVQMNGAIKRPGKFELKAVETFDKLLSYGGGFSDSAYRGIVQVTRLSDSGIVISDLVAKEFSAFVPRTGDAFKIAKNINRFSNRVTVEGAILRPGDFELKPGMTLKQLLEIAGGLREDAFTERGLIKRQKNDLTYTTKSFVVRDVISGKENVLLNREDVVSITSILDLRDELLVNLGGSVRNPGDFNYTDSLTLKDLILKGGGFLETANTASVEISRRIKNPDIMQRNFKQTEIITVDLSKGLSSEGGETRLMPFDVVNVRAEPGYNNPRQIYIQGEVMNTGRYILQASGERLSSVIKRAGSFKGSADSTSITIRRIINPSLTVEERQAIIERMLNISRDSIKKDSRLQDNFLKDVELLGVNYLRLKENIGGNEDLILENGDIIDVARLTNLVRVNGEVYNPTLLPFENNTNAKYYIKGAGNFTSNANKKGIFVIYPDGRAKSVKRFLFFKSYPSMSPRSEVYVPSKDQSTRKGFGPGEWIAVSSIIASLATLIVAVVNQ
ncbi:MAG: SLBB domain-containing protein [Bacteroidota bacterium]